MIGVTFQRGQRLQTALRIRIGQLELHKGCGNDATHTAVGLEIFQLALVGQPGLQTGVDIYQPQLAVVRLPDKKEASVGIALPNLLLAPFLEKHCDAGQSACNQLFKHRINGGTRGFFDLGTVDFEKRIEISLLCMDRHKRNHGGNQDIENAEHGKSKPVGKAEGGHAAPFPSTDQ